MDDTQTREISGLTVTIDRTLCIGSGNCTAMAPDVFYIDEDSVAAFKDDTSDVDQGQLIEACAVCPVDALIVEDEDGEQIVP